MEVENSKLINGEIIQFRNKLNNEHLNYNINLLNVDMYEIYSISNNNSDIITIGDNIVNGIVSDFFILKNEIFIRYNVIVKDDTRIELKKRCLKLN